MIRTFALTEDAGGYLYDPATGLTHRAVITPLVTGRVALPESDALAGPALATADLSRNVPASLCWSPIVRCNLACPHCLDDTTVIEAGTSERRRIAGLLGQAGVLGVDISGGEPLLLRELPDMALDVMATGRTAVSVTTNGWHLARRVSELVGAIDAVRVSFDGADRHNHDRLRGPGSFSRAAEGVQAAVAAGLPVQIQTVLMRATVPQAQAMVDLAAGLGAGGITFLQMLPIGTGTAIAAETALDDNTAEQIVGALDVPDGFRLRLRTRGQAGGFTVVRADGWVWRNNADATGIGGLHRLQHPGDLALAGVDGSA